MLAVEVFRPLPTAQGEAGARLEEGIEASVVEAGATPDYVEQAAPTPEDKLDPTYNNAD